METEDRIVTRAFERKRAAQQHVADLQRQLGEAQAAVDRWDDFLTMLREVAEFPLIADEPADFADLTVAQAAERVLRRLGGEAALSDIMDALFDIKKFTGKRQSAYGTLVGAMDRHGETFEKVRRGYWSLVSSDAEPDEEQVRLVEAAEGEA